MASSGNTWFKKLRAKQRKHHLRHTVKRFAVNDNVVVEVKKVREYLTELKPGFIPTGFGRKVKGLSHEKRLILLEKSMKRAEFFASLGVNV